MTDGLLELLPHLRCPVSRQRLRQATASEIAAIAQRVGAGVAQSVDGTPVSAAPQLALLTESGDRAYPVVDGIAVLLGGEAMMLREDVARVTMAPTSAAVRRFYDGLGWHRDGDESPFVDAVRFEDLRPVVQDYAHRCHERVGRFLTRRGGYLLDVASGPIQYDEYLAYSEGYERRVCVDLSPIALAHARQRLGDRGIYIVADMAELPFEDGVFAAAVSLHTVYHVPSDRQEQAIRELHRVLAPGAQGVIVYSWGMRSPLMRVAVAPARLVAKLVRAMRGHQDALGPRLYMHAYPYRWFRDRGWGFPLELHVWRSVSVQFTKAYIHPWLGGRWLLATLFRLEDRFPRWAGRLGQYPLLLIQR